MLLTAGAAAQKIDRSLLRLLPKTHARAEVAPESRETIDTAAVKQQINVSFNADGSVRRFSAIATLKEGATGIDVVAADERREATPATMTGLDAPVFNVLGQRVSPKTKGLVIYKGRKYVNH